MNWSDVKNIDWGTILLFGGGLTLGNMLEESGLAAQVSNLAFAPIGANLLIVGFIGIVLSLLTSEFASNTASASIVIPLVLAVALATPEFSTSIKALVVACTFGASFGFMLPVSTPPNAIVFGSGMLPARQLLKCGVIFDILGVLIGFLLILIVMPSLGLI